MKRRGFLAAAAATAAPPPRLVQRTGSALPLELAFTDSEGRGLKLRELFDDGRAVLLVPGYYRCPQLCGLLMQALLHGLQRAGVPRESFRIAAFSIDPAETLQAARARRASELAYAEFATDGKHATVPLDLRLLLGAGEAAARLAQALGFSFARTPAGFEHPAAVVVATPDGRISGYLPGLDFAPDDLRIAIARARGGMLAAASERLALLCSHVEPLAGQHNAAVMIGTRLVALCALGALGLWWWRQRGSGSRGAPR